MDQMMQLHSAGEASRAKPERDAASIESSQLMAGLKELTRFRESTLLVTNLRPALLPPDAKRPARIY